MTLVDDDYVRLAAVSDLHYRRDSVGSLQSLFEYVQTHADVLLLCGDLIDFGLPEEAHLFCEDLTAVVQVPVVAVLGNHEYESGQEAEVTRIFAEAGVTVLDGSGCEIQGIGFAGTKGFAGGFTPYVLKPWGESVFKQFAHEAVNEAEKLKAAVASLATKRRVVLMHYAPIAATCAEEPKEIYPFLGSSRLEEPVNLYQVAAVFHGHAHRGAPEGRTLADVPVYNVAMPLLQRCYPDRPPVRIVSLRRDVAQRQDVSDL